MCKGGSTARRAERQLDAHQAIDVNLIDEWYLLDWHSFHGFRSPCTCRHISSVKSAPELNQSPPPASANLADELMADNVPALGRLLVVGTWASRTPFHVGIITKYVYEHAAILY